MKVSLVLLAMSFITMVAVVIGCAREVPIGRDEPTEVATEVVAEIEGRLSVEVTRETFVTPTVTTTPVPEKCPDSSSFSWRSFTLGVVATLSLLSLVVALKFCWDVSSPTSASSSTSTIKLKPAPRFDNESGLKPAPRFDKESEDAKEEVAAHEK